MTDIIASPAVKEAVKVVMEQQERLGDEAAAEARESQPIRTSVLRAAQLAAEAEDHPRGRPAGAVEFMGLLRGQRRELLFGAAYAPAVGVAAEEQPPGEVLRGGAGGLGAAARGDWARLRRSSSRL